MIAVAGGALFFVVLILAGLALLPHAVKGAPLAWRLLKWPASVACAAGLAVVIIGSALWLIDDMTSSFQTFADAHLKQWVRWERQGPEALYEQAGRFWTKKGCLGTPPPPGYAGGSFLCLGVGRVPHESAEAMDRILRRDFPDANPSSPHHDGDFFTPARPERSR